MAPDDEKQIREAMAKAFGLDPANVDLTGADEAIAAGQRFEGDAEAEDLATSRSTKRLASG